MAETKLKTQAMQDSGAWVTINHTWVYASASTFTINGVDVTAFYKKGMPIRWKQGGAYKYGNIAADSTFSTNTTVTIIVNTDHTIANSAITDNYISYSPTPLGFPLWFNFATTPTSAGGAYTNNPTINKAIYSVIGNRVKIIINWTYNASSGGSAGSLFTIPITAAFNYQTGSGINASNVTNLGVNVVSSTIYVYKYDGGSPIVNSQLLNAEIDMQF